MDSRSPHQTFSQGGKFLATKGEGLGGGGLAVAPGRRLADDGKRLVGVLQYAAARSVS